MNNVLDYIDSIQSWKFCFLGLTAMLLVALAGVFAGCSAMATYYNIDGEAVLYPDHDCVIPMGFDRSDNDIIMDFEWCLDTRNTLMELTY